MNSKFQVLVLASMFSLSGCFIFGGEEETPPPANPAASVQANVPTVPVSQNPADNPLLIVNNTDGDAYVAFMGDKLVKVPARQSWSTRVKYGVSNVKALIQGQMVQIEVPFENKSVFRIEFTNEGVRFGKTVTDSATDESTNWEQGEKFQPCPAWPTELDALQMEEAAPTLQDAQTSMSSNDLVGAEQILGRIEAANVSNPDFLRTRGRLYVAQRKIDKAAVDFARAFLFDDGVEVAFDAAAISAEAWTTAYSVAIREGLRAIVARPDIDASLSAKIRDTANMLAQNFDANNVGQAIQFLKTGEALYAQNKSFNAAMGLLHLATDPGTAKTFLETARNLGDAMGYVGLGVLDSLYALNGMDADGRAMMLNFYRATRIEPYNGVAHLLASKGAAWIGFMGTSQAQMDLLNALKSGTVPPGGYVPQF
ncbi:MAG: hypothetical protein NUW37_11160 [Planctomycetes bacterium]|nr:hypothetical protein [Planctomycetota bacterium]